MAAAVIGFHGQAASGARLWADMGSPAWVDWCPDWSMWTNAQEFSQFIISQGVRDLVAIGYSLGGDFIARLTWESISEFLRGIVVYESPLLTVPHPRSLNCPVMVIWNDYVPRTQRRREEKAATIASWNQRYKRVDNRIGRLTSHVRWSWRPPFVRHAWDRSLNSIIQQWVEKL